jgi:hypothetical protein
VVLVVVVGWDILRLRLRLFLVFIVGSSDLSINAAVYSTSETKAGGSVVIPNVQGL